MAQINTRNINAHINPTDYLADQRIDHLTAEAENAYLRLQLYATQLSATTGSDYVDGEFSATQALAYVRHLTAEHLDAMLAVGLVSIVDGDRWRVEFTSKQTSHEQLQRSADAREQAAETRRLKAEAEQTKKQAAQDKHEHKLELGRQSSQRYRDNQKRTDTAATPNRADYPDTCRECGLTVGWSELDGTVKCNNCYEPLNEKNYANGDPIPF